MVSTEHVETLKQRHAALDREINDEANRPLPDSTHVTELKRQKLRIKELIARADH